MTNREPARRAVPERIGEYKIEEEVSATTTCAQYTAVHGLLPRRVLISVAFGDSQDAAVRILRQAYMLEVLEHPGVVRLYGAGLLPDRRPWLAHEIVAGPTVSSCRDSGPVPLRDALALLRDLAEVLEHVHARGVVHCNLSPDRLVLTGGLRTFPLCIVDWTAASAYDATAHHSATSHYCAPELLRGEPGDGRADVFSLGVIAHELLTGVAPIESISIAMRCSQTLGKLGRLIDQTLASDPNSRPTAAQAYASLAEIADLSTTTVSSLMSTPRVRTARWTPAIALGTIGGGSSIQDLDAADAGHATTFTEENSTPWSKPQAQRSDRGPLGTQSPWKQS